MSNNNSDLNQDWKKTVKEVNAKIREAAKNIEEAQKLASKAGVQYLTYPGEYSDADLSDDDYEKIGDINTSPLEGAMDDAGWNTSSWGC